MSEQQAVPDKSQTIQRRMAVQRGVEQAMNEMIRSMRELVDQETRVVESDLEKHQFSNLLAVALETPSVELVKNFILYQVGRDTRGTSWRKNRFGEALVNQLDSLKAQAQSIAKEVLKDVPDPDVTRTEPTKAETEAVWIELARQYLGQLNRYFYYKKEARRW
jgi:hypothetical protein